MFDKEKALEELFKKIATLSTLSSPVQQMKETLKLQDWLNSIYMKGHEDGFKDGQNSKINIITKSN